jgi:levanbiose-producing levanase
LLELAPNLPSDRDWPATRWRLTRARPHQIDANARSVHLRIFVDTQSVEVFVNFGHTVLSQ